MGFRVSGIGLRVQNSYAVRVPVKFFTWLPIRASGAYKGSSNGSCKGYMTQNTVIPSELVRVPVRAPTRFCSWKGAWCMSY